MPPTHQSFMLGLMEPAVLQLLSKVPCWLQGKQDADGSFSSRASCGANRNPVKGAFPKNYRRLPLQLPVMNGLNWGWGGAKGSEGTYIN